MPASNSPAGQTIEQLRSRYEKLNEQRIKLQTERDNAQKQLRQLQEDAVEQFGTADVGELKKQLQALKEKNERQRAEYEKSLDEIESRLNQIEEQAGEDSDS